MRGLRLVPYLIWLLLVALVCIDASAGGGIFMGSVAITTLTYCLVAQAFALIAGHGGRLAFGNVLFFGLGAYITAAANYYDLFPVPLGVVIAIGSCSAIAYLLSLGFWRLGNVMFGLVTFALSAIAFGLASLPSVMGGSEGVVVSGMLGGMATWEWILVGGVLVALLVCVVSVVGSGELRLRLATVRGDLKVAAAAGMDGRILVAKVWALSAGVSALAGCFYGLATGYIVPSAVFGLSSISYMIVAAILGGMLSPWGPVAGIMVVPLLLYLNRYIGSSHLDGLHELVFGIIIIVAIKTVPQGLVPVCSRALQGLRQRSSRRADGAGATQVKPDRDPSRSRSTVNAPAAVARHAGRGATQDRVAFPPQDAPPTSTHEVLRVTGAQKHFAGVAALRGITLTVGEGEILGLVGSNGAGKTTLFRCIAGEERLDTGAIIFAGTDISDVPAYRRSRMGIRRTFQVPRLLAELTVHENIAVAGLQLYGATEAMERAAEFASIVGIRSEVLSSSPATTSVVDLRRAELARAMVGGGRLLLLDEVMSGLSEGESSEICDTLLSLARGHSQAIVMVEHALARLAAVVPRMVVLDRGSLIADGPSASVLNDPAVRDLLVGGVETTVGRRETASDDLA